MRSATTDTAPRPEAASAKRGRPRSPRVDAAIIAAAAALLVEVGYAELSMEAVASRAGVSKATVYRRYRDKEEVVAATILATTDPPPPGVPFPGGSARQNLTAILKMAGVAMSNPAWPAILRAMLSDPHGSGGLLPTVSRQVIEPGGEAVRNLVDFGVANGELRPSVTGAMLHEVLFGTLVARSMLGKPITDEWIENLVASVWQGFGADQPESESETGSAPGRRGRRD